MVSALKSILKNNKFFSLLLTLQIAATLICLNFIVVGLSQQSGNLSNLKKIIGSDGAVYVNEDRSFDPMRVSDKLTATEKFIVQKNGGVSFGDQFFNGVAFSDGSVFAASKKSLKKGEFPSGRLDNGNIAVAATGDFSIGQTVGGYLGASRVVFQIVGVLKDEASFFLGVSVSNPIMTNSIYGAVKHEDNNVAFVSWDAVAESEYFETGSVVLTAFKKGSSQEQRAADLEIMQSFGRAETYKEIVKNTNEYCAFLLSFLKPLAVIFFIITLIASLIAVFLNYSNNDRLFGILKIVGASKTKIFLINLSYLTAIYAAGLIFFAMFFPIFDAVGFFNVMFLIPHVGFNVYNVISIIGFYAVVVLGHWCVSTILNKSLDKEGYNL